MMVSNKCNTKLETDTMLKDYEMISRQRELDLRLLKKAVSKIISDESYGDYTAIEELFQFLDNPTLRLTGFTDED